MSRLFSSEQAQAFYDRFGEKQDAQAFYEDRALELIVSSAALASARHVFELGCGTGRLARTLLQRALPAEASYCGADLSTTMVRIAAKRLHPFSGRALVIRASATSPLPLRDGSVDRFLSTYVLDLLGDGFISRPGESGLQDRRFARLYRVASKGKLLRLALERRCAPPLERCRTRAAPNEPATAAPIRSRDGTGSRPARRDCDCGSPGCARRAGCGRGRGRTASRSRDGRTAVADLRSGWRLQAGAPPEAEDRCSLRIAVCAARGGLRRRVAKLGAWDS